MGETKFFEYENSLSFCFKDLLVDKMLESDMLENEQQIEFSFESFIWKQINQSTEIVAKSQTLIESS